MKAARAMIMLWSLLAGAVWAGPAAVTQAGQVQVELRIDGARYGAGEPVEFTLTVTNPGPGEVVFEFTTGQMYDVVVTSGGRVVWRWSHGKAFVQAFTTLVLKPVEPRVFRARWDQKDLRDQQVPAGQYEMVALFPATRTPAARLGPDRPRIRFDILAGCAPPK